MRNKKRLIGLAALALAATTVAACSSSSSTTAGDASAGSSSTSTGSASSTTSGGAINVLVVADQSGPNKTIGTQEALGVQAGAAYLNAHGGVLGRQVSVTILNDDGDPATATSLVVKALAQNPTKYSMIYPGEEGTIIAALIPIVKRDSLYAVDINDGSSGCVDASNCPTQFSLTGAANLSTVAPVGFFSSKKYTNVGLLSAQLDFTQNEATDIQPLLTKAGIKYETATFPISAVSVTSEMSQLKSGGAQAVYAAAFGAPIGYILQARAQLGWNVPVVFDVAGASFDIPSLAPASRDVGCLRDRVQVHGPVQRPRRDWPHQEVRAHHPGPDRALQPGGLGLGLDDGVLRRRQVGGLPEPHRAGQGDRGHQPREQHSHPAGRLRQVLLLRRQPRERLPVRQRLRRRPGRQDRELGAVAALLRMATSRTLKSCNEDHGRGRCGERRRSVLVTIWSGLVLGSIYALVATGFTIAMLPTGVFNFAHGAIVVGGSFLIYQFITTQGLPSVPAVVLTMLAGAVLGVLCELLTVRPLRAASGTVGTGALVTTVGASTAIAGWLGVKWGYIPLLVPFVGPSGFVHGFGILMRPVEITVVALAIVSALACELIFRKTRPGQACLAVAEDIEPAMLRGINVSRFSLIAFALSGIVRRPDRRRRRAHHLRRSDPGTDARPDRFRGGGARRRRQLRRRADWGRRGRARIHAGDAVRGRQLRQQRRPGAAAGRAVAEAERLGRPREGQDRLMADTVADKSGPQTLRISPWREATASLLRGNKYAIAIPLLLALVVVGWPLLDQNAYWLQQGCLIAVLALVVSGVNLSFGFAGELQLGQIFMFAVGAYLTMILASHGRGHRHRRPHADRRAERRRHRVDRRRAFAADRRLVAGDGVVLPCHPHSRSGQQPE